MPANTPLAVAWIQVRADDSRLGSDVAGAAKRASSQAADTVKGGFREGLRGGLAEGRAEAEAAGTDTAKGFRGKLVAGLQGVAEDTKKVGTEAGEGVTQGAATQLRANKTKLAAAGGEAGESAGHGVVQGATKKVHEEGSRVGETLKEGLKASLAGLSAGLLGLGAIEVFKGFLEGATEARKASALTEAVLRSTGGAAHVTAEDVDALALAMSNKTGVDDDAVHSGENVLLTFTNVRNEVGKGNDIFNRATAAALDYSVATGRDLVGANRLLGRALNDPIKGMALLTRAGIQFTADQQAQIRTLVQTGHTVQAQGIILDAFGKRFGGAAEAAATPMAKLRVQIENLGKQLVGDLLPIVDKLATTTSTLVLPALAGVGHVLESIPGPVYAAVAAFAAGRIAVGLFGSTMEKVALRGGAVATLRSSLGGLVSTLGGPWGIALGAAAIGVGIFLQKQQEARQKVDDLAASLNKQSGAVTADTRALAEHSLEQSGALAAAERLGLNLGDVTDAALGSTAAMARINAATRGYVPIATGAGVVMTSWAKDTDTLRGALNDSTGELAQAQAQARRQAAAMQTGAAATRAAANTTKAFTLETQVAITAQIGHQKAMRATVPASDALKTAYNLAKAALQNWLDVITAQQEQFLGGRAATRAYKDAIDAATKSIKDNGRTLNDNTAKGRANEAQLDGVSSAGLRVLESMVKQNAKGPAVRTEWEHQRAKLREVYLQFDNNIGRANDYVDKALGKIPPNVRTNVSTPGLAKAQQDIKNLGVQIQALRGKNLNVVIDSHGNALLREAGGSNQGHASGGYITGPGGPRDDKIPARLSNGEFVVNAQATSRHRELLEVINNGREARPLHRATGGLVQAAGYATGGVVRRVNANTSAHMPQASWVARLLGRIDPAVIYGMGGGGGGGTGGPIPGGSGVARWAPMVTRALQVLGLSTSLVGKVLRQIATESGGNPNATQGNIGDINNRTGDLARGIMQVIGATFRAFHWPGTSNNVYDPWANILAGLNYAKHRYGNDLSFLGQGHGYDLGGLAHGVGLLAKATAEPERVLSPRQTKAFEDWMDADSPNGRTVRLHPDTVGQLANVIAGAMARQPVVIDGGTLSGYVDRRLGVSGLSVRG